MPQGVGGILCDREHRRNEARHSRKHRREQQRPFEVVQIPTDKLGRNLQYFIAPAEQQPRAQCETKHCTDRAEQQSLTEKQRRYDDTALPQCAKDTNFPLSRTMPFESGGWIGILVGAWAFDSFGIVGATQAHQK